MGVFICKSGVISDCVCLTNFVSKIQVLGHSVLTFFKKLIWIWHIECDRQSLKVARFWDIMSEIKGNILSIKHTCQKTLAMKLNINNKQ